SACCWASRERPRRRSRGTRGRQTRNPPRPHRSTAPADQKCSSAATSTCGTQEGSVLMVVGAPARTPPRRTQRWRWLIVFGGGLALWIIAVLTVAVTGNPN